MNVKNNRYHVFLKVNNCFTLFIQIINLKEDTRLNKFCSWNYYKSNTIGRLT